MTLPILLAYILTPAAVLWLCSKIPFLNKIGPVLLLYLVDRKPEQRIARQYAPWE